MKECIHKQVDSNVLLLMCVRFRYMSVCWAYLRCLYVYVFTSIVYH